MAKTDATETVNPLDLAHEARSRKAAERAKMSPEERAKADYMELINDAADRILNGGRNTIAGAVGRLSAKSRETGKSALPEKDIVAGLDYLDACVNKCREILAGGRDSNGGFQL
jgi:hypothetical protein